MAAFKHCWSVEIESKLISLVKKHPVLWNRKNKKFSRSSKKQIWFSLSLEMKKLYPKNAAMFTSANLKSKFNTIQARYFREMYRAQSTVKELYLPRHKDVLHFKELSFMKEAYSKYYLSRQKPKDNNISSNLEISTKLLASSLDTSKFQLILPRGGFIPAPQPNLPASPVPVTLPNLPASSIAVPQPNLSALPLPVTQSDLPALPLSVTQPNLTALPLPVTQPNLTNLSLPVTQPNLTALPLPVTQTNITASPNPFFQQTYQVMMLNQSVPKLPEQQMIFDQLDQFGGVPLEKQLAQRQLKPKPQLVNTESVAALASKPNPEIVLPKWITRNRDKNPEVKAKQGEQLLAHVVSSGSAATTFTRLIKIEPTVDEGSTTLSKTTAICKKRGRKRGCKPKNRFAKAMRSNVYTRSKDFLNEQLSKLTPTITSDPLILRIKEEPLSPENSDGETTPFKNNDKEPLSELITSCKGMSQEATTFSKDLSHFEAENATTIEELLTPKIEIVESCSDLVQSNSCDTATQISNQESMCSESSVPENDESFSSFCKNEEGDNGKYEITSTLPVIETVFSAAAPGDSKIDEQLESFGNFVSASLRNLPSQGRHRVMSKIYNLLRNPNL